MTISHRGSRYEIGSGRGFYGIWLTEPAAPTGERHLVQWWPHTPEGWHEAWSKFAAIEVPGTIAAVGETKPPPGAADTTSPALTALAGGSRFVAPALLAVGVVLGIAGLFPGYFGPASLASQSAELTPHLIYLAGWAAGAGLLLGRGPSWRPAAGALLALGTSAVTFGLFFADLGTAIAGGRGLFGTGLLLSLLGWVACAAGAVAAVGLARPGSPRRLLGRESVLAFALTVCAAVGAAVAFAPSWDSYTLRTPSAVLQTVTAGNAFSNPGLVIAGDVAVMAMLVAVVVIAGLWQPVKLGAALLAGATIPLLAQAISAVVQIQSTVSPLQFGISSSQARQAGLTISSGLTAAYWIYGAFVLALVLIVARMLTSPAPEPPAPATPVIADAASEPGRTP